MKTMWSNRYAFSSSIQWQWKEGGWDSIAVDFLIYDFHYQITAMYHTRALCTILLFAFWMNTREKSYSYPEYEEFIKVPTNITWPLENVIKLSLNPPNLTHHSLANLFIAFMSHKLRIKVITWLTEVHNHTRSTYNLTDSILLISSPEILTADLLNFRVITWPGRNSVIFLINLTTLLK